MYTKGSDLLKVCGGESHWRAELEGEVVKMMENLEWLEREIVRDWPLMGSEGEEREKGRGVLVRGSKTEVMERERVSREMGPEWGVGRERRAEEWMVEDEKSKKREREMWVASGCDESVNECGSMGAIEEERELGLGF